MFAHAVQRSASSTGWSPGMRGINQVDSLHKLDSFIISHEDCSVDSKSCARMAVQVAQAAGPEQRYPRLAKTEVGPTWLIQQLKVS